MVPTLVESFLCTCIMMYVFCVSTKLLAKVFHSVLFYHPNVLNLQLISVAAHIRSRIFKRGFLKVGIAEKDISLENLEILEALRSDFTLFLVTNYNKSNALNCKYYS